MVRLYVHSIDHIKGLVGGFIWLTTIIFVPLRSDINSMARIIETVRSRIDLGLILDLHAYETTSKSVPNISSHHTGISTHQHHSHIDDVS